MLDVLFDELLVNYKEYTPPKKVSLENSGIREVTRFFSAPPDITSPVSGVLALNTPFGIMMRIPGNKCGLSGDDLINFYMRTDDDYQTFYFTSTPIIDQDYTNIAAFQFIEGDQGNVMIYLSSQNKWVIRNLMNNPVSLGNFLETYFFQSNFLSSNTSYSGIKFYGFSSPPTLIGDGRNGYFTQTSGDLELPTNKILNNFYFYPYPFDVYQFKNIFSTPGAIVINEWVTSPDNFLREEGWLSSSIPQSNSFSTLQASIYGWWFVGSACVNTCENGEGCYYNDLVSFNATIPPGESPYACYTTSEYHQGSRGTSGIRGYTGSIGQPSFPGIIGQQGLGGEVLSPEFKLDQVFFLTLALVVSLVIIVLVLVTHFLGFRNELIQILLERV